MDLPLVDQATCQNLLRATRLGGGFILDTSSFLCAGGQSGRDACTGDGGAPLVCQSGAQFYAVGLVAWVSLKIIIQNYQKNIKNNLGNWMWSEQCSSGLYECHQLHRMDSITNCSILIFLLLSLRNLFDKFLFTKFTNKKIKSFSLISHTQTINKHLSYPHSNYFLRNFPTITLSFFLLIT